MNAVLVSLLGRAAFMRHPDPARLFQPRRVGMVHECNPGELLARAAFMHHIDKGHTAFKSYAALTGLGGGDGRELAD